MPIYTETTPSHSTNSFESSNLHQNDKNNSLTIAQLANSILTTYSHIPSFRALFVGLTVGIARIITAKYLLKPVPWISTIALSSSSPALGLLNITLLATKAIIVPLLEESVFRKNLETSNFANIMKNSILFGLMHGFLPGPVESRIARIFMSTIGGFFYCGAKIIGKDTWSSAIAHSMYNFNTVFGFF